MIAAYGCFKQNLTVVTIYATLGDDAIAHGINETGVNTVITSHDLLPKFKRLLGKLPSVKTIVYMEDQLKPTDTTGYEVGCPCLRDSEISIRVIGDFIGARRRFASRSVGKCLFISRDFCYHYMNNTLSVGFSVIDKSSHAFPGLRRYTKQGKVQPSSMILGDTGFGQSSVCGRMCLVCGLFVIRRF